jgi:hypothetical protein
MDIAADGWDDGTTAGASIGEGEVALMMIPSLCVGAVDQKIDIY